MPFPSFARALLVTLGPLLFSLPACRSRHVTPGECKEMLDHYIDMNLAADPAFAHLPPSQAEAAREMKGAVKKAEKSYRQVQSQCEAEVRRHEYDCAVHAKTPNDWEACID